MFGKSIIYLLTATLIATLVTAGVTPIVIFLYHKMGWDKKHDNLRQNYKDTHQKNVPRGGGLAIFMGLLLATALMLQWDIQIIAIMSGALILTITGVLDDIFDLSPLLRLGINFIVAIIVILTGVSINFVTNPFGPGVIELQHLILVPLILTLIYIVAIMNITNWSKGVDGQLPGVTVIAAAFIGILALRLTQNVNPTAVLSFITAGSFLGFLLWNFYPQKIMPGYGGGSLAGYLLAVLSILAGAKVATLFMVLALPIADASFTVLRRLIAGKSPFLGDRGHLHHKLLDNLGWGRRRIALFYWLVTLIMGILALLLPTLGKIITFFLVAALVFLFLIQVKLKDQKVVRGGRVGTICKSQKSLKKS